MYFDCQDKVTVFLNATDSLIIGNWGLWLAPHTKKVNGIHV